MFFLVTLPVWLVAAKLHELYDRDEERADHTTVDDLVGVLHWSRPGRGCSSPAPGSPASPIPTSTKLTTFWAFGDRPCDRRAAPLARASARAALAYMQNTLIVGAGDVGQLVARKILQHPEYGINLVGFVDDAAARAPRGPRATCRVLGRAERLPRARRSARRRAGRSSPSRTSRHEETLELVARAERLDVQIDIVPRLFELVGPNVDVHTRRGRCRCSGCRRRDALAARRGRSSARSTSSAPSLALVADRAAASRSSRGGSGATRRARSSSGRRGSGSRCSEFTALKFRTMRVGRRRRRRTASYIERDDGRRARRRRRTASTSSTAATRSRRSAAGCARRASTSCRS